MAVGDPNIEEMDIIIEMQKKEKEKENIQNWIYIN